MALFLSTFYNKIDKKGRVSVPASFRAALNEESYTGIVVYNSFSNDCIEACGLSRIEKINDLIDQLEPFSEERDALATAILGNCCQLPFDPEGRVILPADLISKNSLEDQVCFVGKGATFEIWHPDLFNEYNVKAAALAKNQRGLLSFKTSQGVK